MTGAAGRAVGARAPDLVVHCRTLLSCGPCRSDAPAPVERLAGPGAEAFGATMNHCAGGVAVLDLIDALLPPDGTALLVVGDKAFHPAVRHIRNTTIMGDGAVAMLASRRPGRYRHVATHTERRGRYAVITGHPGERTDPGFAQEYTALTARCIEGALARAGLSTAEVRRVMPHNVNRPSWERIAEAVGLAPDRIHLANVPRYGHTFGADPFLNLMDADAAGELAPGDHVVLVSVGLGATASAAVLRVLDEAPAFPRARPAAGRTARHPHLERTIPCLT